MSHVGDIQDVLMQDVLMSVQLFLGFSWLECSDFSHILA